MAREFGTVGVVGLGTMGSGITEVLARSKHTAGRPGGKTGRGIHSYAS